MSWYEKGYKLLMQDLIEIAEDSNNPEETAKNIYAFLSNIGMIDYDIEKEVIFEEYCTEEDED
jgi:hypothetical protein